MAVSVQSIYSREYNYKCPWDNFPGVQDQGFCYVT